MANIHELSSVETPVCPVCDGNGRLISLIDGKVGPKKCFGPCGGVKHPSKTRIPDHLIFQDSYAIDSKPPTEQQQRNRDRNR